MQKLAKRVSVLMTVLMTLSLMLNFVMAAPAKAATTYPQVQYATEPKLEYEVGDIVNFDLHTPNYGGRVQYRVVLWNDETKSYKDLWTASPDRYYTNWMPYGNNIFNLHWKIDVAGHYRITIYAKRAGIPNNETFLKGFNCDSYFESDSFVVKAKAVVVAPDVAAESLKIAAKSAQAVFGKDYEVKADVKKAGVKVVFLIDAPVDSLNKDITAEAISDTNGIATYKYTRNYGDADVVTAYSAAAPSIRDTQKVYWGVKEILTVTSSAPAVNNNGSVQYEAKLIDPRTGAPMANRSLYVMFKENVNAQGSTALASSAFDLAGSRLFQINQNYFKSLMIKTDINGVARFTVQGANTSATPIVFYDDRTFYAARVLDSTQFDTAFAGNGNEMLDVLELQCEAPKATFASRGFDISVDGTGVEHRSFKSQWTSGRVYKVTVNYAGTTTPYAGGVINIGINELLDSDATTTTFARFIPGVVTELLSKRLDSKGQIKFELASNLINDKATPVVWIDKDTPSPLTGDTNHKLDAFDQILVCGSTIFDDTIIATGLLEGPEEEVANNEAATFTFSFYDQNDEAFIRDKAARIKYTFENVGTKDLVITNPQGFRDGYYAINNLMVFDQWNYGGNVESFWPGQVIVRVGQTITIVGTSLQAGTDVSFDVRNYEYPASNAVGAKVKVSAYANLLKVISPNYYSDVNAYLDGGTVEATFKKAPTSVELEENRTYVGKIVGFSIADEAVLAQLERDGYNRHDQFLGTITILRADNTQLTIPYYARDRFQHGGVVKYSDTVTLNDYDNATDILIPTNNPSGYNVVDLFEKELNVGDSIRVFYKSDLASDNQRYSIFQLINSPDANEDERDGNHVQISILETAPANTTEDKLFTVHIDRQKADAGLLMDVEVIITSENGEPVPDVEVDSLVLNSSDDEIYVDFDHVGTYYMTVKYYLHGSAIPAATSNEMTITVQ